ncbi:MAG: hypothetical protein ACLT8C_05350 [Akkermansia muciniphila]
MYLALAMLLLGTAFKIGAVPMQLGFRMYQGAPTCDSSFRSLQGSRIRPARHHPAPFAVLPPVELS